MAHLPHFTKYSKSDDVKILMENQLLGIGQKACLNPDWSSEPPAAPEEEEKQPNLEPLYKDISNIILEEFLENNECTDARNKTYCDKLSWCEWDEG